MIFYYHHGHVGPSVMMNRDTSTLWWCVAAILLVSGAPGWARPQAGSDSESWQPVSSGHRVNRYTTITTLQHVPSTQTVVDSDFNFKYLKINNLVNQTKSLNNYDICFTLFKNEFQKLNKTNNILNLLKCLRLRIMFRNKIHKYNLGIFKDKINSHLKLNNTKKQQNNNFLRNVIVKKQAYGYVTDDVIGYRENVTGELLNNSVVNYFNETKKKKNELEKRTGNHRKETMTKETIEPSSKLYSIRDNQILVRSRPRKQRFNPLFVEKPFRAKRSTYAKGRILIQPSRSKSNDASSEDNWLPVQLSSNSKEEINLEENSDNLINEDLVSNFVSNSLPDLQNAQETQLIKIGAKHPEEYHIVRPADSGESLDELILEHTQKPDHIHKPWSSKYPSVILVEDVPDEYLPKPPPNYHLPPEEHFYPTSEPEPYPHSTYQYPKPPPSPEPPPQPFYHYPSSEPTPEPARPVYHDPSKKPSPEHPSKPFYHYPSSEPFPESPTSRPIYHYPASELPLRPVYHYPSSEPSEPLRPTYHYPSAEPPSRPVYHYPSSKPQSTPVYHFRPTSKPIYHYPRPEPEPDPEPEPEPFYPDPEPEPEFNLDPSPEPSPETFDDPQDFTPGSNPPANTPEPPFIILASPQPGSSSPLNPVTITSGRPPPTIVIFSDNIVPVSDTPPASDVPVNPIPQPPLDEPIPAASPPASSGVSPLVPPLIPPLLLNPSSIGSLVGSGGQGGSGGNGCPTVQVFNSQLITNSVQNKECTDMTINLNSPVNNHNSGVSSDDGGSVQLDDVPDSSTVVTPTKKPKPSDSMSILEYVSSFFASLTLFNPISISFWSMLFAPVSILLASGLGVAALVLPWAFPRFWFGRSSRSRRTIDGWHRRIEIFDYRPRFLESALQFEKKLKLGFDFQKFLRRLEIS